MRKNKKDERIKTTQATQATQTKLKSLNAQSMLASLIVVTGALLVFLGEGDAKKAGMYIIVFGMAFSFVTRYRIWKNKRI
jgi:formate/nitrite transporter FocA (FNT family)